MVKKIVKCSILALGLLFIYTPILLLVVFSFTPATTLGVWEGFSFDLYIQLFNNAKIMNIVKDTIHYFCIVEKLYIKVKRKTFNSPWH